MMNNELLALYLPDGYALKAKYIPKSNIYKLNKSIDQNTWTLRQSIDLQLNQYNINTTSDYLVEYEIMLGVGSIKGCFTKSVSKIMRSNQIRALMYAYGANTCDDIVKVVKILGYDIKCTPAIDVIGFPYTFPVTLSESLVNLSNTLIIDLPVSSENVFPYTFPLTFSDTPEIGALKCFIESLINANIKIIYISEK